MIGLSYIKKLPVLLLIFLAVGLAGLVSIACSGSKTGPADHADITDTSDIKKYDRSKTTSNQDNETDDVNQKISNEQVRDAMHMLKKVSLNPKDIRSDSAVTIEVETAAPLEENQYITYAYSINSKSLEETREVQLAALSYKKHDILYADVMLYEDDQVISKKRTGMYEVLNSPPVIDEVTLPDIKGPGTYQFIVKAHDVDNDQLTFSLVNDNENMEKPDDTSGTSGTSDISLTSRTLIPAFDGQIDTSTGIVTWTIDESLPDAIKFTIAADDGDGGITKKIVSMRFFRRPVKEE